MTHDPPKLGVPMAVGDMKFSTFHDGTPDTTQGRGGQWAEIRNRESKRW